jgi:hypothetical protein
MTPNVQMNAGMRNAVIITPEHEIRRCGTGLLMLFYGAAHGHLFYTNRFGNKLKVEVEW